MYRQSVIVSEHAWGLLDKIARDNHFDTVGDLVVHHMQLAERSLRSSRETNLVQRNILIEGDTVSTARALCEYVSTDRSLSMMVEVLAAILLGA